MFLTRPHLISFLPGPALQAGVDKGWLLTEPSHFKGRPCMQRILRTAREVAEALRWLHSVGIVHGDLTGGNVLLDGADCSPTEQDPRGFVAKVSNQCGKSLCCCWAVRVTVPTH